jgi:hypothetical protein
MTTEARDGIPADLPAHLRERIRPLGAGRSPREAGGEFVLCWLHHALRADENPAVEVALHMGVRLGLPIVAYFGLGGRHRFNADRHHRFMLEGAREAQAALEARGIRCLIHVPKRADAPSPLPALASRAGLIVTEDFPAPPFPRWTRELARASDRPTWRVDCACVLPMRLVDGMYDRAFAFRDATRAARAERVARPWPPSAEPVARYDGPVGFESLDLSHIDLAALIAECEIDHGLPPVAQWCIRPVTQRHVPSAAI